MARPLDSPWSVEEAGSRALGRYVRAQHHAFGFNVGCASQRFGVHVPLSAKKPHSPARRPSPRTRVVRESRGSSRLANHPTGDCEKMLLQFIDRKFRRRICFEPVIWYGTTASD